jgi:hypothetical protein
MRMQRGIRLAAILFTLFATTACGTVYAQGRRGYPYPTYPSQRGGVYRGGYSNPAYERGFDAGYRRGLDAARDGDRYDVRRERDYRNADRRYGSRSEWQRVYRDGFASGYDQGYRDARYRNNGRYRPW